MCAATPMPEHASRPTMKQYVVGIDLGTSNTVVAYAKAGSDDIRVFDIDQLVSPGEVAARPLLPSLRYHAAPGELSGDDLQLPWQSAASAAARRTVFGRLAATLGAQVPGRLVTSAKSWLSHASVDRTASILPWGADEEVGKISPVVASASYLGYVCSAWNHRFPEARLEDQDVVLTVPASFDEGARALTLEAARMAGLPALRLLEEPQAALYDWLFHHRRTLDADLAQTRLVLICDVGGGTTDLTLIRVEMQDGQPQLTRIGVGNHLMLGGDNMDLALAHLVEARFVQAQGSAQARLSAASLSQLVARCRVAKEQLLGAQPPDSVTVTLLGTGSRLIGGARSVEVTRQEIEQLVVDGFFPKVSSGERPGRARGAIVEFGLPYASDPAVTRHVASFLSQHAAQSRAALDVPQTQDDALPMPDTLLLNGGVFRAEALADRIADTLATWRGEPLHVLHNDDPDVAVARGAVAYARARAGQAPRIGGGSPRSYFLVLDDGASKQQGICLLPRGTEEGHEIHLSDRTFALRLGHPVQFHLVSSVADTAYQPGELTGLSTGDFVRLPPIATVVQPRGTSGPRETPVQLTTWLTEVGTLEVHCAEIADASQRWRLEFQLRGNDAQAATSATDTAHASLPQAIEAIERTFGARSQDVGPKEVKRLRAQLEQLLGARAQWDSALLRELFGAFWERVRRRRRTADHERLWLNLAGYCVRPGFGYPLDEWRVEQLWSLYDQGIQYVNESQNWSEWWTLWRRAAGGLDESAQLRLLDDMAFYLQPPGSTRYKKPAAPARAGYADMVRLAGSLERIPAERKIELAEWLLARLRKPSENSQGWWAVGRIGARRPFYGSAHGVVPVELAAQWVETILALDWKKVEPAAFAAVQIARMTGDRSRDLPDEIRSAVVHRLEAANAPQSWIAMVREAVELDASDEGRVFGEALPSGLKLIAG
ncbi:Hsp70 family protein [Cupriavidus sp. IDO]|uniref:Hsp70 family protein n=1 Tax=Cupriavidus sp. IDO TaxID=1539142 RepID=UPI0009E4E384|nr:Hsp70 family protein [Cupriavidus sp. IDO]